MANNLNRISMMGRIGADPTMKILDNGNHSSRFSIAVDREVKVDGVFTKIPNWFNVVAFGNEAKYINSFGKKGNSIMFEGHLQQNKWIDPTSGDSRESIDVIVDTVVYLGKN